MGGRQPMRRLFMLFLMFGLCAAWGQGEKKGSAAPNTRSEEHTSELQSQSNLVCRLLLEKKKNIINNAARECCRYSLVNNTAATINTDSTSVHTTRIGRRQASFYNFTVTVSAFHNGTPTT